MSKILTKAGYTYKILFLIQVPILQGQVMATVDRRKLSDSEPNLI
jgi:hypothetical protein